MISDVGVILKVYFCFSGITILSAVEIGQGAAKRILADYNMGNE